MLIKVGIPRALLYYHYFPMWRSFFEGLGVQVVVSGHTTKSILEKGAKLCVDEACLPVKVAFGHVAELVNKADFIFIPRLVSIAPREYICPKFLGFPDMVKGSIADLPPLISLNVNQYRREGDLYATFSEVGKLFTRNPARVYLSYRQALRDHRRYCGLLEKGLMPDRAMLLKDPGEETNQGRPAVAVIGHPYNIYDNFISMNLIKRLTKSGFRVVTPEHLPEHVLRQYAGRLPKRLFWTLGQKMIGGAFHCFESPSIKGLIHVASFACGPDSMTGELIERRARKADGIPFLNLTLDEHTGEAGVVTRLEAFLDMINLRAACI